jgi:hypothetical protein
MTQMTVRATGRKNSNLFEIYGDKGAVAFNLERMNELEFLDATLPSLEQGFRTVLVTEAEHPYLAAWWPPGRPRSACSRRQNGPLRRVRFSSSDGMIERGIRGSFGPES